MATEQNKYLVNIEDNLDVYAAHAADAKAKVDELKKSNEDLKKSGTATAEQIERSNAELKLAQKEYTNATKTLQTMTAAQKANGSSYDDLYKQWQAAERQLKSLSGTVVKNADGTITLTEEYKKASAEVAKTKAALNEFTTGVNDGRNNVGLYGEAIKGAFGDMAGQLSGISPAFKSVSEGLNIAKMGFVSLRGAIMATGIGALVIALVSLFQYFTKTKEGAAFLSKATAGLGAAFDVLMKVAYPLGQALIALFTKPKQALTDFINFVKNSAIGNIFKGLGKLLTGHFSEAFALFKTAGQQVVNTVHNIREGFKKMGAEALEAAKAAAALAEAQMNLAQANVDSTRTLADLQKMAEKYKQIADDDTRSFDERAKAADKADQTERAMLAKRVQLTKEAYRLATIELEQQKKRGNDTIEVQQKAADAYATLRESEQAYTSAINDNGERRRKIELDYLELRLDSVEKGFEAVKAANVSAINNDLKTVAERKIILENLIKIRNDASNKEIELLEANTGKQIDLADLAATKDSVELDRKLKGLQLSEKATIRLQDVVKNQIDTNTEFTELQLSLDQKALDRKKETAAKEKEILDEVNNLYSTSLNERTVKAIEIEAQNQANRANATIKNADDLSLRLQEIEITKGIALRDIQLEQERKTAELSEEQRNLKAVAEINAMQVEADQKAQLLQDNELLNQQTLTNIAQTYDLQRKQNAQQTESEITANQKFEIELRKKALEGTVQVASDVFGVMSELVGKQTAIGKAFAITQAIINTYSSAVAAYNSAAQVPYIGYILGPIAAAGAIAAGLKNVQAIKSASTSGGSSTTGSGSTVSASFTAANQNLAAGAVQNSNTDRLGSIQQNVNNQNSAAAAAQTTANALKETPIVVTVEAFNAKAAEKKQVEVRSNI